MWSHLRARVSPTGRFLRVPSQRRTPPPQARWFATKRQKRIAAKRGINVEEETENKPITLKKPFDESSLILPSSILRTDLTDHQQWMETQRPSFSGDKPPSFEADPSGVVKRDLTEAVIDLKDMYDPRLHSRGELDEELYEASTPLSQELIAYISVRGAPITVAEYMRQALTHPLHGYYTNPTSSQEQDTEEDDFDELNDWDKDDQGQGDASHIIGRKGDFVTAPEVSQVFGECLCVWFVTQWQTLNSPSKIQLVEVGPGKGTLMADFCRSALKLFPDFGAAIQKIHLVEASPVMRTEQQRRLEELNSETVKFVFQEYTPEVDSIFQDKKEIKENENVQAEKEIPEDVHVIHVQWHDSFTSVLRQSNAPDTDPIPSMVLCQELIDALPVHVFEKTDKGWRERMVDVAKTEKEQKEEEGDTTEVSAESEKKEDGSKQPRLRFVLSEDTTPALRTLLNVDDSGNMQDDTAQVGDICEVCPEGILLSQDVAELLTRNGGAALIVDYGQEGSTDSIRAFSRHNQVNVLSRPGQVDVTADVDFAALRHAVNVKRGDDKETEPEPDRPHAFGPVSQGKFLSSMGATERVIHLIEDDHTTDEQAEEIYHALERLVLPEHMGERYKVLAIARKKDGIFAPPGF